MLRPVLVTAPIDGPVTLDEAKLHLRVDASDEDELIEALVDSATAYFDGYSGVLGRCLMQQTWRQDFSYFASTEPNPARIGIALRLPFADVSSVVVKYYDANNVQQTVSPASYQLLSDDLGSLVGFVYMFVPPNTYFRTDAVSVEMTVGATDPEAVDARVKQAIKLLVGDWYQSRETMQPGRVASLPFSVDALIAPLRRVGI